MYQMFTNCYALTSLDLKSFGTSKFTNMGEMFKSCTSLTTIVVSNKFVTSSVTSSTDMFHNCIALVGGNGTTLATVQGSSVTAAISYKAEYARVDNPPDAPGYFTLEQAE